MISIFLIMDCGGDGRKYHHGPQGRGATTPPPHTRSVAPCSSLHTPVPHPVVAGRPGGRPIPGRKRAPRPAWWAQQPA